MDIARFITRVLHQEGLKFDSVQVEALLCGVHSVITLLSAHYTLY